jgi:S-adenosyl-L-methionine hydrolase (adenosine-forming)
MKPSGIITLTSDFGLSDPYVAMMKGVILSINPSAVLVDLTHMIKAGSVSQAAALVRETFVYYPMGTVHLAVVDPGVGSSRRPLAVLAKGHFFVGPDNGVFWPVIEGDSGSSLVHLQDRRFFLPAVSRTFHGREIFAPVAAHLSLGVALESLGTRIEDPVQLLLPGPHVSGDILSGQIVRVDNFGNLVTNIPSRELGRFLGSRRPRIEVGKLEIQRISGTYADGEEGEPLALINSSDVLEIAVNLGRASEYIGVRAGDIIGTTVKVIRV